MIVKSGTDDRILKILNSLKNAAAGDYSAKLDFASQDDEFGLIADAVNNLLQKTDERLLSSRQTSSDLTEDARRYRHIIDNIEESYFEVDLQGNLLFFNDTVIRDLGYSPEEIRGINFHQFVDKANARKVYETFHQVFLTGRPIKGFDWQILKKNKEIINVESSVALLRDETGRPVGFRGIVRDISQRMQSQEDLRQSEEKYRTILDIMGEGYFESDLHGAITFVNDAGCNLVGCRREELIDAIYNQYSSPETMKRVYDICLGIYKSGIPNGILDYGVILKDGSIRFHQQNIALMHDVSGRPTGFRALVRDVTERKKAEDALRESEEKYRNILENMEETYLETDLKGNFVFFNNSLCRLFGYSREELQNMNYRVVNPLGLQQHIFEDFNEIYRTGKAKTFIDHAVKVRDGSIRIMDMSMTLLRSPAGEPIGFAGIGRDVTEKVKARRKIEESERHLRLITNNIRDIIWTMDFDLRWTYLSPSVLRMTGFAPEEVMKMPLKAIMPPDTYAIIKRTLSEELSKETRGPVPGEQRTTTFELPLMRKNGACLWVEISTDFTRDEHGKPLEIIGVTRDISKRKKAEDALRESEKRYRMIVENMNDSISIVDLNFNYIYQSPSEIRVTGYTPEEIMSIPVRDQMTAESYDLAEETLTRELTREFSGESPDPHRSLRMELEVYHKKGGTIWEEMNAIFQRDDTGKPIGIIITSRDITARRKAETALAESEKLYRMIVENVHDVIVIADFNFKLIFVSNPNNRITGYALEEIKQIPIDKLLTPASLEIAVKAFNEEMERDTTRPINQNLNRTLELEILHKHGGTVWVEINATFNRDAYGRATSILLAGRNITERKKIKLALEESEKRYRMIVENMQDVIWTTDLNLKYNYVSPSVLWLTGYSQDELFKIPGELLMPQSYALAETAIAEELAREFSGEPIDPHRSKTIEQEIKIKNGNNIWLEITATFVRDEQGKPIGIMMAGRDITARKKAEAEKDKLEAQLIQAQKMETVGRLAGGVAHDFNNMLSVILGYVDLAKLRLARQHPVLKDIAEIEKAAVRSRDITSQLLAFSRKQIIEPKIIDLNELVSHSQKALIRLIGEDIEMKVLLGDNLSPIMFDPSQIEQILINLAVNARDAMQGGGKLTIETANIILDNFYCENHAGFKPGTYVRLSFSDNGAGMDKEILKHIFEPFFTTKEVGKGTGLGLATVYGIVKQNNGFINVYSEPEHGTTFSIYLRRAFGKRDIQADHDEEPGFEGHGNILLVEDDAMVLQITKGMLEAIGYTVISTNTPPEALSLCKNPATSIDLVITDVVMPVMSGKELRQKLVEIRPDLKVIFMSGYTAEVIANHDVLEVGTLFLQKPFTIKDLAGKVAEAMAAK